MKTLGLAGNPNSGKTTLFNQLTGLRQRTGNYPGITTEIHKGQWELSTENSVQLLDLPGAYSLYPNTSDEFQLVKLLLDDQSALNVDLILYVVDVTELDKQLLLLTQLLDLGLPCVVILTMIDKVEREVLVSIENQLQAFFKLPIIIYRGEQNDNDLMKRSIGMALANSPVAVEPYYQFSKTESQLLAALPYNDKSHNVYRRLLYFHHHDKEGVAQMSENIPAKFKANRIGMQIAETMKRYENLQLLEHEVKSALRKPSQSRSDKLDRILTNPIIGPILFLASLLFIFQAIYAWTELPMNWIDSLFSGLGSTVSSTLGEGAITDFIVEGILAGLGGILVFVPQIAILFFLLGLMEESGYMARAVYMFDHIMRRFGLSGKSMVSLMSAGACAIPAVMSTRSIENNRERLITILVSPFVSCSARIPVYTILIGLAVPAVTVFGIFNLKGLVFTSLYLASVLAALIAGLFLKFVFKREQSSEMLIELPHYKAPNLKNVVVNMWSKTKAFVWEAGKIILVISMILWFLGSYGPGDTLALAEQEARTEAQQSNLNLEELNSLISSKQLEASYAGRLGKWMEPVIEPLGYDWKIGIALLASFAAREVFVGTMATIYSMEHQDNDQLLQQRLANEINPKTGQPMFNLATAMSLIVFFLFAMQCMSTLAIVKRETGTWKWPILQFVVMSTLAYVSAFFVYQSLS